jgi:hypothetical protein
MWMISSVLRAEGDAETGCQAPRTPAQKRHRKKICDGGRYGRYGRVNAPRGPGHELVEVEVDAGHKVERGVPLVHLRTPPLPSAAVWSARGLASIDAPLI